jgi:hypothetical protein
MTTFTSQISTPGTGEAVIYTVPTGGIARVSITLLSGEGATIWLKNNPVLGDIFVIDPQARSIIIGASSSGSINAGTEIHAFSLTGYSQLGIGVLENIS